MGILRGIRVLDLATYIAGPAAATIMSDFGAEVIKVERPPYGDPFRYLSRVPGMPVSDLEYCWMLDSRNKRSIAIDLGGEGSRPVLEALVRWCDVLVTNFQPSQLAKFRLRHEDLRPLNERMIYASVNGYGEQGDEADKPGFDMTGYWARSGLMGMMHNAGCDPAPSVCGFGDHPTSTALFGAVMLGLYERERTGRGSKVTTSLIANGAWSNSSQLQAEFVGAQWTPRRTRRSPSNPLVNHYVTRDGQRFMFCLLDAGRDWARLCAALGWSDERRADPRFTTPEARREHSDTLVAMIDEEIAKQDMTEWSEIFRVHEIVWGLVPTIQQVANDPQMEANGVFERFEGSEIRTVMSPIQVEGVEKQRPRLAPAIGQHSVEVLQLLGYSEEDIRQLLACGAIVANS